MELAGEAEKLAKRLHPRHEEAAEHHAIDAFLGALERPLAAEVQKLGCHTMEDVVAAARRVEKILEEQNDSKMERLILSMQDQIRILTKDLNSALEQMVAQQSSTTPTAALTASPAATVAAAQPPPLAQPPSMAVAHPPSVAQPPLMAAAQPPPLATAQPPPYPPARHLYQDYAEEGPYFRPPRRQQDRRSPRCFLCGEEGHFVSHCPARSVLQRLLCQQARELARGSPRGQVLELPPADDNQGSPQTHLNY